MTNSSFETISLLLVLPSVLLETVLLAISEDKSSRLSSLKLSHSAFASRGVRVRGLEWEKRRARQVLERKKRRRRMNQLEWTRYCGRRG